MGVIGTIGGKGGNSSSNQSNSAAADLAIPPNQKSFTSTVESFKSPYDSADSEIKKTNVRFNRKAAISNYFSQVGSLQFQGWVGQVQALTTESDGKAYISIKLAGSGVVIQTWNNSLSDIVSNTMISRSDPLYPSLMNIKEGDDVTVSGTFIQGDDKTLDYVVEASLTEDGSMSEPEFIVKFNQISKK